MQQKVNDEEEPQLEPHLSTVVGDVGWSGVGGGWSSSSKMSLEFDLESKVGVENLKPIQKNLFLI